MCFGKDVEILDFEFARIFVVGGKFVTNNS
jgi:hypothetical protein